MDTLNHYAFLKISPTADQPAIEAAFAHFKAEITEYGPRITLSDEELNRQFPEICAAYKVLLDPEKRKGYDATLEQIKFIAEPILSENTEEEKPSNWTLNAVLSYLGFGILFVLVLYAMSFFFAL